MLVVYQAALWRWCVLSSCVEPHCAYWYVGSQVLEREESLPSLEPAAVPGCWWNRDYLSLLPPQFLTWVWKNICLLPPLCYFWESNSCCLYSASVVSVVSQGMTFSLQYCLTFPQCEGVHVRKLKGERNITVLDQNTLFIHPFSNFFPSASPSECLMDFQGGGGWEEVMLYYAQFYSMIIALFDLKVLCALSKTSVAAFSFWLCSHSQSSVHLNALSQRRTVK